MIIIDLKRLLCPMPVIRVQNQINHLAKGSVIKAVCSDPGALQDIPAWCRLNGHRVLETDATAGEYTVVIEVA